MKILEKTQNKLVCQSERNVGMYVLFLIVGLGLGGIPLLIIFLILASSTVEALTCKRIEPTQVNCELTQSTYMGLKKEPTLSLSKVMGAKVNKETDSGYRVRLLLRGRKCLIFGDSFFKMNKKDAQKLANTIANFLNLSNPK
jgi:hypothetical protein